MVFLSMKSKRSINGSIPVPPAIITILFFKLISNDLPYGPSILYLASGL